jgi:phosphate transport system protein
MQETRRRFHDRLDELQIAIRQLGELAEQAVGRAVDALGTGDQELARRVIAEDDEIDERYLDVERDILDLLATQSPVATDLRLLTAILHINLHLERIGDMAVNIAKIYLSIADVAPTEGIVVRLQEMGDVVRPMIRAAMTAFADRDIELCLRLPEMDDPVDRLNLGMYKQVVALASDEHALGWGLRMQVIARQLERVGDHAVDIAEQVGFLITGEFREFTDASHPVDIDGGS